MSRKQEVIVNNMCSRFHVGDIVVDREAGSTTYGKVFRVIKILTRDQVVPRYRVEAIGRGPHTNPLYYLGWQLEPGLSEKV